jgi:thiamine pyrophosphokinase
LPERKRAVIFANGELPEPELALSVILPGDLLIAADGGGRLCRQIGLTPDVLVGDFDSLEPTELEGFLAAGAQAVRYPQRKDFTDLELALRYALQQGCQQVVVLGALGARWDQTLANLILPAAAGLEGLQIRLLDGRQEISLVRPGVGLEIHGQAGDTVSLIPLAGDALNVRTQGLEYPLEGERLLFGATRGVSNTLLSDAGRVTLEGGLLLCVVIHQ